MKRELVIAHYNEDLTWVKELLGQFPNNPDIRVTIYDKAEEDERLSKKDFPDGNVRIIPLTNIGREPQTFLHHLCNQYDKLADATLFAQGNPFEHFQTMKVILSGFLKGVLPVKGFTSLADVHAWEDRQGGNCFKHWDCNLKGEGLELAALWKALELEGECPEWFHFGGGGQFMLTRERAQRYPRDFYRRAKDLCRETDWRRPHEFERLWKALFGAKSDE